MCWERGIGEGLQCSFPKWLAEQIQIVPLARTLDFLGNRDQQWLDTSDFIQDIIDSLLTAEM